MGKVTDTLILSRLFKPVREGGHSLRAYGIKFGYNKIDFKDFSEFSLEMLEYCIRDVKLTRKVYDLLQRQGRGFSEKSIELEHDVSKIIEKQVQTGFSFLTMRKHTYYLLNFKLRLMKYKVKLEKLFLHLRLRKLLYLSQTIKHEGM